MTNNRSSSDVIIWATLFLTNFIFIALTFILPPNASSYDPELALMGFQSGLGIICISFFVPKIVKNMSLRHTYFLGLAFNEQASLMALIVAYIFGDPQMAYLLFGLSIIAFLIKFPKTNPEKNISKLDPQN